MWKEDRLEVKDLHSDLYLYGQQKQLELGLALSGNSEILLLDEPTAGMSIAETTTQIKIFERVVTSIGLRILIGLPSWVRSITKSYDQT